MDEFGILFDKEYTTKLDEIVNYLNWDYTPHEVILMAVDTMHKHVREKNG